MIKAESTITTKKGVKSANTEVTLEGTGREILHEFIGIVRSLKEESPELLITALKICKEEIE